MPFLLSFSVNDFRENGPPPLCFIWKVDWEGKKEKLRMKSFMYWLTSQTVAAVRAGPDPSQESLWQAGVQVLSRRTSREMGQKQRNPDNPRSSMGCSLTHCATKLASSEWFFSLVIVQESAFLFSLQNCVVQQSCFVFLKAVMNNILRWSLTSYKTNLIKTISLMSCFLY